jgi:hypothetical protein
VRVALDQLSDDERSVVKLAWFDGLAHTEIAELLGVPVGTVKSRSHRAQRRLAELLAYVRDVGVEPTAEAAANRSESANVGIGEPRRHDRGESP